MSAEETLLEVALAQHMEHPEQYVDVHVGLAPRDWMLRPARDLEGLLPEARTFPNGITVFHEKGGFFVWHEDYESGEHEPGHLLVRIPVYLYNKGWLHARSGFDNVADFVSAFTSFVPSVEDEFRLVDYMVVDRDITCWGDGKETFLHRVS